MISKVNSSIDSAIQTLLKAVEKGKRKRMQVDIKYFPFIPSLSSVSVM